VSNFTYDITAPGVTFNSPAAGTKKENGTLSNGEYSIWWAGTWETGAIKIGGVADDTFGVEKIYYHIGKLSGNILDGTDNTSREDLYKKDFDKVWIDTRLDTTSPAANWSGGLYYWNYVEDLNPYRYSPALYEKSIGVDHGDTDSTFYLPFYVMVFDRAGNINVVHYKVFVDPDKDIPSTKIVSPVDGVRVGGEIRITGTANDNNWVHSVDIKIIDERKSPGTEGYYYRNPGSKWVDDNTGLEVEDGKGTTSGFVKAKIVGNTDTTVSWYYNINADGKLTPDTGMSDRPVTVEVRAWDTKVVTHDIPDLKNKIPSVVNYIFDSGVPTIGTPKIIKAGNPDRPYIDGIRVSDTFTVRAEVKDNGGIAIIRARLPGKQDFKNIVSDGKKTSVLASEMGVVGWNVIEPITVGQSAWAKGWRYYITNLGSGVNWKDIDLEGSNTKTYAIGTSIKYNGSTINGSGAEAMKADGTQANTGADTDSNSYNWNTQFFKYTVEFTIDSTKTYPYGKTGIYTLELDVVDNNTDPAPNVTKGTFSLGIDNFYPFTEIATKYNATTGTFKVMGTAKDYDGQSGSQQGLERVLVYFSRTKNNVTTYYNARGIAPGTVDSFYTGKGYKDENNNDWASGISMVTNPNVRDMTKEVTGNEPNGAMTNFPYLKLIGDVWQSPHAMVIDSQEINDATDTDEDGTYAEVWPERVADKEWQARLDTELLTAKIGDGPLTVHYIIMDLAGNATHYTKDIYIANNKPVIRSINLGTDINASGGLTSDEYLNNAIGVGNVQVDNNKEIETGFRVRNKIFGFKLDALYGNNAKHYRISHVTRKGTPVAATSMKRGIVYTVADPGDTEWTKYGALFNSAGITFVATGPADGSKLTGTVYEYDYTSGSANKTGHFTDDDATESFTGTDFDNMPDTPLVVNGGKKEYIDGKMKFLHDKHFIVKVYDTTVSGEDETEQLSHVVLLNVDFDNEDGQKPLVTLKPFYWNSLTDNSIYESDQNVSLTTDLKKREALNGHIELEGDLPTTTFNQATGIYDKDPKVSGKISFRGTAYDNIVINNIYFAIDKHANNNFGVSAVTNVVAGSNYYPIASFSGGKLNGDAARFTNNGWKFTVTKETLDQDGHYIEWRLDYDSSFVTNVANTDVTLSIVARDSKATPNVSDKQEKRFDVVPYITKITTRLSEAYKPNPSAFDRSAQGWYPVHEDEVLTIDGFNLLSGTDPTVDIRPTAKTTTTTAANTLYTTSVKVNSISHTKYKIFANVDSNSSITDTTNTITSGYLFVKVNGIDSINNINENTAKNIYNNSNVLVQAGYNMEGNGLNNDTLTDDRALYVWNTGYISDVAVKNVSHPFMRMNNSGVRVLSYGRYTGQSTGRLIVNRDNTLIEASSSFSNRMFNTTVGVGASNNSWYAAGSDQSSGSGANENRGFQFGASIPGGNGSPFRGGSQPGTTPATSGSIALVTGLADSTSNRFKIPRIAVQPTLTSGNRDDNNSDRVLISYFDAENNTISVIYGNMGNATAGAPVANSNNSGTVGSTFNIGNIPGSPLVIAEDTDTFKGSQYTAVGFLKNGLPVMAWYDRLNQNLVFSWAEGNNMTTGSLTTNYNGTNSRVTSMTKAQWQGHAAIIDTFKGTHVDLAVDGQNNVHIAYYDQSNGGLYYALIPATGTGNGIGIRPNVDKNNVSATVKPVKVDTYLSAGTKLMINVRNDGTEENPKYVPYISYAHASFGETKNSIRVAWRTNFDSPTYEGSDANDALTGKWEVMTVPVSTTVVPIIDEFVCNGVPVSGTITAPGGTSTLRGYTSFSSILVGYMTDKWYEGAALKK